MSKALFENMSDELRNLSREMSAIEEFKGNVKDVEEVIENINSPLTIMVMGEFSTGKSTFINALMGEAITKVDAKPTTAVITKLVYGERDRIVVHYQDGSAKEYGRAEFERLTAEADAQSNEMHERMDYVERTLPIDMLKSMSIIDSPGLNSIKSVHEDMTRHFMDKADTVLWMFDANKPGSQTEIDALKRLNPRLTPLVLVNKIDDIDEEEGDSVEGILGDVERRLKNNGLDAQGYIGISAKLAFQGERDNKEKLVSASNIRTFYSVLEKMLSNHNQYRCNLLLDDLIKIVERIGSYTNTKDRLKKKRYHCYKYIEGPLISVWREMGNVMDIIVANIDEEMMKSGGRINYVNKIFARYMYLVGCMYRDGRMGGENKKKAIKWYEKALLLGAKYAECDLDNIMMIDLDINKVMEKARCFYEENNYSRAERWYKKAARGGNSEAMYKLGEMLQEGMDQQAALKWYTKAAEVGCEEAKKRMIELKLKTVRLSRREIREKGDAFYGVGNYNEARKWYCKAIEVGDPVSMCFLGRMYQDGKGVKKDYNVAIKWYVRAAEGGNAVAMRFLGENYEEGKGVLLSYQKAFEWYMKAAKNGDALAMNNIGVMYYEGKGVLKDYDEAMKWCKKSVKAGCDIAREQISLMERNEGWFWKRITSLLWKICSLV